MKVLISAFKPFNDFKNNYSMEVLQYVEDVDKTVLDVVYDESYYELVNKYNLNDYDLIIAMGEARSRNEVTLETQAVNISSCSLKDNKGMLKQNEAIMNGKDEILQTKVDLTKIKDIVSLSYDAGKFVCNNIYFHLLSEYPNKSLFIHIPNCNDSVDKYKEYAKLINKIINILK